MTKVLQRCPGVAEVTIDLNKGTAVVKGAGLDSAALTAAVDAADYKIVEATDPEPINPEPETEGAGEPDE